MAMFISEIPVRYQGEKTIKWIKDLHDKTTVRDVIDSIYPTKSSDNYSLYLIIGRYRKFLDNSSLIYDIVSKFHQQKCARRLLFEIRSHAKKHVRFADEIVIQDIQGRSIANEKSVPNMIETVSMPIEKRLQKLKENFQKTTQQKQEIYHRRLVVKKSILIQTAKIKQISRSSSESGFSSSSSNDNLQLETLV